MAVAMEGMSVEEGVSFSPVEEGSGEGAVPPPQKIFVILHFKWCIFMQFGIGILYNANAIITERSLTNN